MTSDDVTKNDREAHRPATEAAPQPLLEYVCHPAKRNRTITILTTVFLLICVVLVYLISFSPFMTALGAIILFVALTGFYLPTRYSFYDDYFIVKTTTQSVRKEWSQYRSYYADKNGVLLSPFARRTRLENFRGIYIKFAGNRDEVLKVVAAKISFEKDA